MALLVLTSKTSYCSVLETKNKASEAQQIKALHKLLKQGILTEEEFNLKKRKVLGIKSKRKRRINYVLISALVFVIISIVLYYNTTINPYQSPKLIFRISAFITLVLFVLSMYKKFKKHVA